MLSWARSFREEGVQWQREFRQGRARERPARPVEGVFGGMLCAYDLPGGSLTAKFTRTNDVTTAYEESVNGWAEDMTIQLVILEATGISLFLYPSTTPITSWPPQTPDSIRHGWDRPRSSSEQTR